MAVITINDKEVNVPDGITLIQACEIAGVEIPRFCYHERLAIAGNCRMCLVEVVGAPPKPVASCATPISEGMKVKTDSPMVKKAREGVMEFLLANHPLDCPICDQAGECDLQDQSMAYGRSDSRFHEHKRAVRDKNLGPLVSTQMNRCIHCTRCVRFMSDVAGVPEMGAIGRGETMEITNYLEKSLTSELSGNIIDLCPVGALTSKPYSFKARSWELTKTESIDVMDAVGSNIRIDSRGMEVMRILPRLNEEINEEWISDKTRFCYDALKYQRLDQAYIKENGKFRAVPLEQAYQFIAKNLQGLRSNEIAALSGRLSAVEDVIALKLLMEKLGSNNIDCREIGSKINASDPASYSFNTTIAGIDQADSCLLIGSNPRIHAPIINARIRKRFLNGKLKVAAIGVNGDLTYKYENLGNEVKLLEDILNGNSPYNKILENSSHPMLIIGEEMLQRKDGAAILNYAKKIAEKYKMIRDGWNGFNMLHNSASLTGALLAGFVSSDSSINSETILDKASKQQIKAVYLLGVDDIDLSKLQNCFVIYQGSHGEAGTEFADVILPAASYTEKEATFVNIESRPQKTARVIFPLKDAKEDCQLIHSLAKVLNLDLGFDSIDSLRQIMAKINPIFANLNVPAKHSWISSNGQLGELDNSREIAPQDENFYSSNIIARLSKILNSCKNSLTNLNIAK
ncbi:MAG: nuoG [Rickettsiaceae bacterium]|jgi:NADH-quinone oxidoreductase subunit G|nr:nuoG [Rickettsiaceae bacterium]